MKKKILFLAEGILLLILFALCFSGSKKVIEINSRQLHADSETDQIISDEFTLKPGVYRITVTADVTGGGIGEGMGIGLAAEKMTFHAIRGNRATLYAGTEYKEITYYVTAKVTSAYVSVQPFSDTAPTDYQLKVESTAAGHRIAFSIALLMCAILDGLYLLRKKVISSEWDSRKKWTVCALVGIWLTTCVPLMVDYLITGTDSVRYLTETEYLLRGEWRNIPWLHLLYLWIPAGMRMIGFPVMTAYKVSVAALILAAVLLFYLLFSKQGKDVRIVLLATAFGVWNPVSVKMLYTLGNPGKFVVYALIYAAAVWVLWLILKKSRVSGTKISSWILFAITLVLILQVIYFEDKLTFESDVNYWYNEEPFMTGE